MSKVIHYTLPFISETILYGKVTRIMVTENDLISHGQYILELEWDWALIEIPSDINGRIVTIETKVGDTIEIGDPLFTIEVED